MLTYHQWILSDIHIRAITQGMTQPSIIKIHLTITYLKFHSNFPGTHELRSSLCGYSMPCDWYFKHIHTFKCWKLPCLRNFAEFNIESCKVFFKALPAWESNHLISLSPAISSSYQSHPMYHLAINHLSPGSPGKNYILVLSIEVYKFSLCVSEWWTPGGPSIFILYGVLSRTDTSKSIT